MKLDKLFFQQAKESPLFIKTGVILSVNIVLAIATLFIFRQAYSLYTDNSFLKDQVGETSHKVQVIRENKEISQNDIDRYNATLDAIIPATESYFQVITALEKLAQQNNVEIMEYSINLQETTPEKFSLNILVAGDPTGMTRFLQNYMYSSGRLITNEALEFNADSLTTLDFNLNLYHTEVPASEIVQDVIITDEDIQFISEIATKI